LAYSITELQSIDGSAQPRWYIWPKTNCWRQTNVATFGGGERNLLLLPPGAENSNYATENQN